MPTNSKPDKPPLGIALSTVDGRLAQNHLLIEQISKLQIPVVLVNQMRGIEGRLSLRSLNWSSDYAQIIHLNTLGLSLSRNAALDALRTPWVMLADDDITLDMEALDLLVLHLQSLVAGDNVGAFVTRLMKDHNTPWRSGKLDLSVIQGRSIASLRRIQRINSMELVLNAHALRKWGIQFDQRFGLGSPHTNGGEEVMILNEILRHSSQIVPIDLAPRMHAESSSGQVVNADTAFTQGAVHRLVFGGFQWLGLVLIYALKRLQSGGLPQTLNYVRGGIWASRQA